MVVGIPPAAAEDAELGLAAQLPHVQTGRGGDGAATEEAQRGVAAQDTEIGVVGRLPDAQAGRGGGLAEAEGTGLGVAAQLPVVQAGLGGSLAAAEKARRVWAKLMLDRCRDLV